MFFSQFPKTLYSFNLAERDVRQVTNIFSRVAVRQEVLTNVYAYYKYQLQEGDTPEIVSQKEYNNPMFHWIICYVNGLRDPIFDFPLEQRSLENYIVKKYNYNNINEAYSDTYHYVLSKVSTLSEVDGPTTVTTSNSIISLQQYSQDSASLYSLNIGQPMYANTVFRSNNVDANSSIVATLSIKSTVYPVTVFEYENGLNESKREIKLLKQQYVEAFASELGSVLNG